MPGLHTYRRLATCQIRAMSPPARSTGCAQALHHSLHQTAPRQWRPRPPARLPRSKPREHAPPHRWTCLDGRGRRKRRDEHGPAHAPGRKVISRPIARSSTCSVRTAGYKP
eukprot:scaffold39735_cov264-Isochrysis_galbana.AAC.3